jgi:hypothetical protein
VSNTPVLPVEIGAYSVESFSAAHGISRAYFYTMLANGTGPAFFKLGKRTLISKESAQAWREWLTATTPQKRPPQQSNIRSKQQE